MEWSCEKFEALSSRKLYEILKLRVNVFVVEQNCPYPEIDGNDYEAIHVSLTDDEGIAAYTRLLPEGVKYKNPSIGRVIVRSDLRGTGLAHKLMGNALNYVLTEWRPEKISLQAQTHLTTFYSKHGFEVISEPYLEDKIPHVDMLYPALTISKPSLQVRK